MAPTGDMTEAGELLQTWTVGCGGNRSGRLSNRHPHLLTQLRGIQLGNRFSILEGQEDRPLPASPAHAFPAAWLVVSQLPSQTRWGSQSWVTATIEHLASPVHLPIASPPRTSGQNVIGAVLWHLPPATQIVGDSIIRNIRRSAMIHSLSGAKVSDILHHLPGLLTKLLSVQNVISLQNDIRNQRSEILIQDFYKLFSFLQSCGKTIWWTEVCITEH